jgi:hypothetical protein
LMNGRKPAICDQKNISTTWNVYDDRVNWLEFLFQITS